VLILAAAELFARFYLGLGDPPLMVADPQIEYLYKPSMHYRRFGHDVSYNAYSMRSGPVTPHKTNPAEIRVLVIGDSVVNGGAPTDDSELATTLLQTRLSASLGRPVFVGNVSAGSWGPPNELAYVKRFGWFDADAAVVVYNSADYADAPTFERLVGVAVEMPDHRPLLALEEGFTRYLLPRLFTLPEPSSGPTTQQTPPAKDVQECLEAVREIVRFARASGVRKIMIAQHLEQTECGAAEWVGHAAIAGAARDVGIEPLQLGPAFEAALRQNRNPYRDKIHPNALGQKIIADVLFDQLKDALTAPTTTTKP